MKPKTVGRAVEHGSPSHPFIPATNEVGFASGTIILTMNGEIPVESLSAGDRIICRDTGVAQLIGMRKSRHVVQAISIAAGSLGHTRPDQDLILPGDQQILIRDWRAKAIFHEPQSLVCARDLVDGEFVCDLGQQDMVLHQLQFSTPHVIYAGGLEAASAVAQTQMALQPAA